jgi:hypothetical protein
MRIFRKLRLRRGKALVLFAGTAMVLAIAVVQSTIAGAIGESTTPNSTTGSSSVVHRRVHETSSSSSDLYFIKTDFTGSGDVEIHSATAASDYESGIDVATRFKDYNSYSQGFPPFGWWQMVGTTLYFVKTRNTGSGYVEIHSATAASGYKRGIDVVTRFSEAIAGEGVWQMVGPDLYFIRTDDASAGPYIEIFSATAKSGYRSGIDVTTRFGNPFYSGDYQLSDGNLYFLKLWDDKYVQVHSATSSSEYQSGINELARFTSSPKFGDWWVMSGPNLYMIKTFGSGSHDVEVHSATAASGYKSGTDVATRFGEADAQYGCWQIGSES